MIRALLVLAVLGATGCNLILGLDETHTATGDDDAPDAMPGDFDAMPGDFDAMTPDAAPLPGDCTLLPQSGCNPGDACDIDWTAGSTSCRGEGGSAPGEACTDGGNECIAGTTCLATGCRQFCNSDADCSGSLGHCHGTTLGVSFCDATCDLRTNDCDVGAYCQLTTTPDNNGYATYCIPGSGGTISIGGDCQADPNGCVPGSLCLTTDGSTFSCIQICYVGDGTCANCAPLADGSGQITIHGNELGGCLP